MNYTLHQLHVFLKVSQTKSITKAAEELHLTQPAVSIQIKNFQDQFPIPLTEVIGRKIYITDFGKEIALAAENILNEVNAINYKALIHQGELSGKLRISSVSTGKYIMPYFLTDFLQINGGVELNLDVTNKSKVMESLINNEVDFALVSVIPENLIIEKIELLSNKLFLVADAKRKFSKKQYDHSIFEDTPLIYREPGSGTRMTMENYLKQNAISANKKMELTSNEAVKQAILAGLGMSIMPLIGIKNELKNGDLQIVPVKGFPITSNWNLIWLKNKNFSPAASAFVKFIQEAKYQIVRDKFDWYEQY
jgi:LysR family transcriptional regulator, low CO2-responsive transcriptional regulator